MLGTPPKPSRLTLTPVHLLRVGTGLDGVRVEARGHGLLLGTLGALCVRGTLDRVVLRRLRGKRCRALFLGLHGLSWLSVPLAPAAEVFVPVPKAVSTPTLPPPLSTPDLAVDVTLSPPEPP